jgi:type IV pilus assembly protein PilY1
MHPLNHYSTKVAHAVGVALLVLTAAPSQAATTLSTTPLFLSVTVPPNLVVTLDDSGSMANAYVPDLSDNDKKTRWFKSSNANPLYYNPEVKYPQAKNEIGVDQTTTFAAAYRNGFDRSGTTALTIKLGSQYRPTDSLDLKNSTTSESFADHYSSDVRCQDVSGTKACELYDAPNKNWIRYPTKICGQSKKPITRCEAVEMPAYYYVYDTNASSNPNNATCTGTAEQKLKNNDCYVIRIVSTSSGPGTIDLNGDGSITAADKDELQNFANWYSFARTRNLTTATAATVAFSTLSPDVRVAWQGINSCYGNNGTDTTGLINTNCQGWKGNFVKMSNAIGRFGDGTSGTKKADLYRWLYQQPTDHSTPLPTAMKRAGAYFSTTGEGSPYDNDFATTNSGQLSCRRNYHIMMTDGLWNVAETAAKSDNDTVGLPVTATEPDPDITQYAAKSPYKDSYANTLADMAFSYWIQDLVPTLDNRVPASFVDQYVPSSGGDAGTYKYWNPKNDPATWQHMVNFTIGLGLDASLKAANLTWGGDMYSGSYPDLVAGTVNWPEAKSDADANAADLWHAAINSRGKFFSADNPANMSAAFRDALDAVSGSSGSATSLSTNSTSIQPGNTVVYQAKFSADWTGSLLALPVGATGAVGSELWDAGTRIPAEDSRNIFTFNGTAGVEFRGGACTNTDFTTAQKNILNYNTSTNAPDGRCAERVSWLRGSHANELRNSGTLRNRKDAGVMGDIINSDPAYVKDVDYGYTTLPTTTPGQSTYAAYVAANASRMPMVYVGANDGMLHGIRADATIPGPSPAPSGVEQFAFIPKGVFGATTAPLQSISYLTNPSYTHRYFVDGAITVGDAYLGGGWKTILVAGLNSGGNSVYALDITDPTSFGAASVKWEFTDADMGNSFSQPQIGILESGQWVAIFGNGYNSTSGGDYLYVVNLSTGASINKILVSDVSGDESNGLSTPVLYDADGNGLIDTVYVGDLLGNMWKIDPASGATPTPLFTATNSSGQVQPITSQPKVTSHPLGGRMVVFGTGRYLNNADVANTDVQSTYGIRDNGAPAGLTRSSNLQQQSIDFQADFKGATVRSTTDTVVNYAGGKNGWYLDLPAGERVVSTPLIKVGRAIFVTIKPSTDPCDPGGTSWLMELEAINGAGFPESILDVNHDGYFNSDDIPPGGQIVSGVMTPNLGISKTPVWIAGYKVRTGTGGGFDTQLNRLCGATGLPACAPPPCVPGPGVTCTPPTTGTISRKYWIQIR